MFLSIIATIPLQVDRQCSLMFQSHNNPIWVWSQLNDILWKKTINGKSTLCGGLTSICSWTSTRTFSPRPFSVNLPLNMFLPWFKHICFKSSSRFPENKRVISVFTTCYMGCCDKRTWHISWNYTAATAQPRNHKAQQQHRGQSTGCYQTVKLGTLNSKHSADQQFTK